MNLFKNIIIDENSYLENFWAEKQPYFRYVRNWNKSNKINKIKLPSNYKKTIKEFWKNNFGINVSTKGYEYFYYANKIEDINYIPEDIFYKYLIRQFNKFEFSSSYSDKNMYDKLFRGVNTLNTVIRNMNGQFYDKDYNYLTKKEAVVIFIDAVDKYRLIIKPSINSGGGKNISLIGGKDMKSKNINKDMFIASIFDRYGQDYIVQPFFHQSTLLETIYPHSLNTIRIVSFERKGKISILACVLKMGNNFEYLDKISMGGLSIGIDNNG